MAQKKMRCAGCSCGHAKAMRFIIKTQEGQIRRDARRFRKIAAVLKERGIFR